MGIRSDSAAGVRFLAAVHEGRGSLSSPDAGVLVARKWWKGVTLGHSCALLKGSVNGSSQVGVVLVGAREDRAAAGHRHRVR
jgi:hypothetical protein